MPGTMDPRDAVTRFDEILPNNRLVVHDAGHFDTWVRDEITIDHPDNHIWTLDFEAIGQGLPIGIGSAIATDERTCITFCGDAGIMMSLQELETAVRHNVSIIVIIMNDETLGAEYHVSTNPPDASVIESPDFEAVAKSFGAKGFTVRSVSEINEIVHELEGDVSEPVVIDCKINRNVRNRLYG